MKYRAVGHGAYIDQNGNYWARIWIKRRRTWRRLKAKTNKQAVKEVLSTPWIVTVSKFEDLAKLYIQNGCPDKRLVPRAEPHAGEEMTRTRTLTHFFGRYPCNEIRLPLLPTYKDWRSRRLKWGTGERTVDKDLTTLSNALNYGVMAQLIDTNPIAIGRPKYRRSSDVKHCRESAPADADAIHRLAEYFFGQSRRSEVLGWQLLFAMFTGCRTSELLRLRVDADDQTKPGYMTEKFLFIRRSKGGVNPFCMIGPEFMQMITAFAAWRATMPEGKETPYFFPNYMGRPISRYALTNGLRDACRATGAAKVTPHGVRSFYVTKRRSDGAADVVIAGEIGDKTSGLMETTYGKRPPNWTGGRSLKWIPDGEIPAWKYFDGVKTSRKNRVVSKKMKKAVLGGLKGGLKPLVAS